MVRLSSEKSSVAWFKLAEFVERKEKERALTIYRLLIHSLEDPALISQLEGDLLAAFHDERAVDSYRRAAQLYEKSGRLFSAALLYEHVAFLQGSVEQIGEHLKRAYALYRSLGCDIKATHCACTLARLGIVPTQDNPAELSGDFVGDGVRETLAIRGDTVDGNFPLA